ncbi:serine threonine kinase [Fusarium agapanthi]|uniref:Serine threonine kinase n=1 Tax=Fusarium agapanthi TaxID=1803897 RepID=A0A9P5E7I8_9HYPO|nr:serine threonine kinase [Fusarium agapanthi]
MDLLPIASNSSFPICSNGPLDHRDENLELVPLQPHNNPSSSSRTTTTATEAAAEAMTAWGVIFDTVVKGLTMAVHLKEEEKDVEMGTVELRAEMEKMKGEMGELKGRVERLEGRVATVDAENSALREVVNGLQTRFGGPLPSRRVDGVRRRSHVSHPHDD